MLEELPRVKTSSLAESPLAVRFPTSILLVVVEPLPVTVSRVSTSAVR